MRSMLRYRQIEVNKCKWIKRIIYEGMICVAIDRAWIYTCISVMGRMATIRMMVFMIRKNFVNI